MAPIYRETPLRILLASAHPYFPELVGGAQTSTHQLALAFREKGHEVAVLAGLMGKGRFGLARRLELKLRRRPWTEDRREYPVYRAWHAEAVISEVSSAFGAEVVLLQSGRPVTLAKALAQTDTPTVIYLRNVETDDLGGRLSDLDDVTFIANSKFTASRFLETDGVTSSVIYPMVTAERYRTTSQRRNVTFINPHPHKGVDIALAVAEQCPDIPFVFVKTWGLSDEQEQFLRDRLRGLPNVTLVPPTNDMKLIYRQARIVLAPSRWEEAFGRIAAEAHLSGIPVVGSDRGGLPEGIGSGGVVVRSDAGVEAWAGAIRRLWSDDGYYEQMSAAALRYSERPEMNAETQVERVLAVLNDAVRRKGGGGASPLY